MKFKVVDLKGKESGQINLPEPAFGAEVNQPLMAQAVRVYLANQRKAPAKTLSRGKIRASGRKIWAQKGTGRARHGDVKAPIFVGGAKAHGPRGNQNYSLKLSRKMKRRALFSALTDKLNSQQVIVVEGLDKLEPKTKAMVKLVKKLKIKSKRITFVLAEKRENVIRAGGNIPGLSLVPVNGLHPFQVLKADTLVFTKTSLKALEEIFLSKREKKKKLNKNKRERKEKKD